MTFDPCLGQGAFPRLLSVGSNQTGRNPDQREKPMFILLLPAAALAYAGYGVVRVIESVESVVKRNPR